jgi:hypothetical protein
VCSCLSCSLFLQPLSKHALATVLILMDAMSFFFSFNLKYVQAALPAPPNTHPPSHQSTQTIATRMAANLNTAILFPCAAIRVNRVALPWRLFEKEEKVDVDVSMMVWSRALS